MKAEEEYHKPSKLIACQSWYVPLKGKVIASGYFKASYFYDPQGETIYSTGNSESLATFLQKFIFPWQSM